ncbi:nitrogen regulation protein NR(I) [Lysobacter humi (ex Lee et al. 2017)]
MPDALLWIVDDEPGIRLVLATALRDAGWRVEAFGDAAAALASLDAGVVVPDLLFTDVRMPGEDGLVLLGRLKQRHPQLPVVVMSAYTDVASTAGAFRAGAHEFLSKPFDLDEAVALATRVLGAAQPAPAPVLPAAAQDDALLGQSPAMRELFRAIGRLAQAPLSVLVTGETGTGKELVARALHRESPRAQRPFVALNTAAIPAELLESELFGHEAGAFTGATRRHVGRFEQADGGTLFLDEIGDMPLALQTRLLRVLAQGEFFRVGGRELIRVDVRVLAATHQDLEARARAGQFRADLLHRLDVVRLRLPPLRERREDLPLLAAHFLARAARRFDAAPKQLDRDALARLAAHDWPGNVRELENLCWRLAALAPAERVTRSDIETALGPVSGADRSADLATPTPHARDGSDASSLRAPDGPDAWDVALADWAARALAAGERDVHARARERLDHVLLEAALARTGGRRTQAAALLGLGRNTVTRKLGPGRRGT